jgi:hypothetical protein
MRVDLRPPEIWEDLNASLRLKYFSGETATVSAYPSSTHALYEICEGASNFFSHKRSFGLVKGATPVFTPVLPGFYKDSYQAQAITVAELKNPKEWVDGLKKDTNFVIFSSDNPLTGECLEWDTLDALLNERKIFSLRISHSDWLRGFTQTAAPRPYSAWIMSVAPGLAVAACGEKIKAPPVTASTLDWHSQEMISSFQNAIDFFHERKDSVLQLEKNPPPGWQALPTRDSRLFDRALIYNTELSGESVLQSLYKSLGQAIPCFAQNAVFETANLCRWNGFANHYNWWDSAPVTEVLRGLLILDAEIVSRPEFPSWLAQAEKMSRS